MNAVRADQDRIDDDALTGDAITTTRVIDYLPGLALLIVVGLLGKYAEVWWLAAAKHEHWTVPDIEYVLWAILIGLVLTLFVIARLVSNRGARKIGARR